MQWLAPFLHKGKMLWQQTEYEVPGQRSWRTKLPEKLNIAWHDFITEYMTCVKQFRIPRLTVELQSDERILTRKIILFSDASGSAIASCAYEVIETDKRTRSLLMQAKCHVIPLKSQTKLTGRNTEVRELFRVNKAELAAVTAGVKMLSDILQASEVEFTSIHAFTDSQVVLNWLDRPPEKQKFVYKRAEMINGVIPINQWRHIEGTLNIADFASRGCSGKEFIEKTEWRNGPHWLQLSEDKWPENKYHMTSQTKNS